MNLGRLSKVISEVLLVLGLIFILSGALNRTQRDKNSILMLQKMTKKYRIKKFKTVS